VGYCYLGGILYDQGKKKRRIIRKALLVKNLAGESYREAVSSSSNKTVDIKSEKTPDIRLKTQI